MYMIVATYNNLHVTTASGNNFNKNFKTCTDHNQDNGEDFEYTYHYFRSLIVPYR